MGLWSFLGGAAGGFSDERRYLDSQAKGARDEALRAREQLLREQSRQEDLAYRGQEQLHQIEMDEATAQFRQDEKLRDIERINKETKLAHDREMFELKKQEAEHKFDIAMQDREEKFKISHPALTPGGREAAKQKWIDALPTSDRLIYEATADLREKPLDVGSGERLEDRLAQIDATVAKTKSLFSSQFPKVNRGDKTKELINTLFKGVKTQEEAVKLLRIQKAKVPGFDQIIDEDQIQKYISGLPAGSKKQGFRLPELFQNTVKGLLEPITPRERSIPAGRSSENVRTPMQNVLDPLLVTPLNAAPAPSDSLDAIDEMFRLRRRKKMSDRRSELKHPF